MACKNTSPNVLIFRPRPETRKGSTVACATIWLSDGTNEIPAMVRPDDTNDRAWADAFFEQIVSRCQSELGSVPEPSNCLKRATKLWSLTRLLAGHHGVDAGTMPVMPPVASEEDFRKAVECLSRWGQQQGSGQRGNSRVKGGANLKKIERAILIFVRDTNQSVREVARQVPCSHALLSRNDKFQQIYESQQGTVPKGSKSKTGDIEATD